MSPPPLDADLAAQVLDEFLDFYTAPSFGSPTKRDIDVMVFGMMRALGRLPADASLFETAQRLRITRTRARSLMFDHDVRTPRAPEDADTLLRSALGVARFSRDGLYFVMEVENPYVQALARERIRQLGHISDSSFNASLVRLSLDAATDLIGSVLSDDERERVRGALIAAGAPDKSFKGVFRGALGALGKRFGGEALDAVAGDAAERLGDLLGPLIEAGASDLGAGVVEHWRGLFAPAQA